METGGDSLKRQVKFSHSSKVPISLKLCLESKFFSSETWALPITVLAAVVAYAVLAAVFYNVDA